MKPLSVVSERLSQDQSDQSKKCPIIAIDGPAGSGKSITAYLLAKKLNYLYLDTGAMYRALTLKAIKNKVNTYDAQALADLVGQTKISLKIGSAQGTRVFIDGKEVSSEIRSPLVSRYVSQVSTIKEVREYLVSLQRKIGSKGEVVAEGRDIGTVVFPEATVKIFLTANFEERINRRWRQLREKVGSLSRREIETNLRQRDLIDSQREISPLKKAPQAITVDNTRLNISQTVEKIRQIVQKVLCKTGYSSEK
jgi:cytidylate kinase